VLAAGDLYSVAITHDGQLTARDVRLQGQGRGDVLVSGSINASSNAAGETGGRVEITGERVGLLSGASVDASGPAGGGTILVGGDFQGSNSAIRNSTATSIMAGVSIRADATASGNGGKIVVWSDGDTRYFGGISARGGLLAGNGGFAEVSGKNLDFRGMVGLGAVGGQVGSLLLDPINLTINDDAANTGTIGGTGLNGSPFAPSAGHAGARLVEYFRRVERPRWRECLVTTSGTPTVGTGNINITESPDAQGQFRCV